MTSGKDLTFFRKKKKKKPFPFVLFLPPHLGREGHLGKDEFSHFKCLLLGLCVEYGEDVYALDLRGIGSGS